MKGKSPLANAVAAAMACASFIPAHAHDAAPGAKLGDVHFEVSCDAAAQKGVDLAMAYYHSFAWEQYKAPLAREDATEKHVVTPGPLASAKRLFERALETDEGIAEAHNNLAFSLRMQSRDNFARSLKHYERAIAINPKLAQAYMYRGVLYSQMGDMKRAREDLDRLQGLDKALAAKLEAAIAQAVRDERDGLAPQLDAY